MIDYSQMDDIFEKTIYLFWHVDNIENINNIVEILR